MHNADDLALLSATELVAGYRAGRFTPVDAAEAALQRIDRYGAALGAFACTNPIVTRAAAEASWRRYRDGEPVSDIDGVPVGVKDMIATSDFPTRFGSMAHFDDPRLLQDAPVVARLKEAGAVLLGKTSTPELAFGGHCDNLSSSTRNPWDMSKTSGGSSGGAAVAAATGMGPIQIGGDSGGSIRMPAAFCGVFGLKPTLDRVPDWPPTPLSPYLNLGPLTRTVADAAAALAVLSKADARVTKRIPDLLPMNLDGGIRGWRIGVIEIGPDQPVEADIRQLYEKALQMLAEQGAILEPVQIDLSPCRMVLLSQVVAGLAAQVDALPMHERSRLQDHVRALTVLRDGMTVKDHVEELLAREDFADRFNALFRNHDIMVTPAVAVTAFAAGHGEPQEGPYAGAVMGEWTPFTYPFNLSRNPAASCPIGLASNGLPAGIQIIGPLYREDAVLRAARAVETAMPPVQWRPSADFPQS